MTDVVMRQSLREELQESHFEENSYPVCGKGPKLGGQKLWSALGCGPFAARSELLVREAHPISDSAGAYMIRAQ